MGNISTPAGITQAIRELCKRAAGNDEPSYVPVKPHAGCEVSECFVNVRRLIEKHGGDLIHGWAIWEWPKAFVEAEFHGVWRKADGEVIDPTPKPEPKDRILFVPDPSQTYNGVRVQNRRWPLTTDYTVHEFINLKSEYERLTGDKAGMNRVQVTPELEEVMERLPYVEMEMLRKFGVRKK